MRLFFLPTKKQFFATVQQSWGLFAERRMRNAGLSMLLIQVYSSTLFRLSIER